VVVKLGGHALDSLSPRSPLLVDLAHDIDQLHAQGVDVALVHGGGPQIAKLLEAVGLESHFHEGLRITDATTMGFTAMALGQVNLAITAALNQLGVRCVGLSGADATLLRSTSLGEPWGRTGSVPTVRAEIISTLWSAGMTPVLSPVAVDECGELVNCNADTAAGALAGALGVDVLVLLSDVDQLRAVAHDEATSLESVTRAQAELLLASGDARDGMRPKLLAALDALGCGAKRVLMANGTRAHALAHALAGDVPTTEVVA
jgi:acetylglutamate kinase